MGLFVVVDGAVADVEEAVVDEVAILCAVGAFAELFAAVGEEFFDVVVLVVEILVALTNDSAIAVSGGHKFVVCTKPRSKLKHSKTAAPTELRRATIEFTMVHLFKRIS